MTTTETQTLEELCINCIRFLSADAVQQANSGHPGMPMGAAAIAYTLWTKFLRFNAHDPEWFDRDRFILSAGHGSMLLYSLLHLTGYDLPLDELKRFRQWGSKTPGHPERGHTPGVEVATGPLGQGFGNAVGMAIAEAWLAARFNRPGHTIVDHYTYGICGDGDLMEGVSQEAASLAGHLQLGKLVFFYDHNRISLAGATDLTFTEDVGKRFDAYGWHVRHVENGNDTQDIARAIEESKQETRRPSLIIVRTHIGYGSPAKQDSFEAHGSPLGEEELLAAKKALGWPSTEKFFLPDEAVLFFRQVGDKGAKEQADWESRLDRYRQAFPTEATEFEQMRSGKLPNDWRADLPEWNPQDKPLATRAAGGQVLNALAKRIHNLLGGSADLNPSTNTALKGEGNFQPPEAGGPSIQGAVDGVWGYAGRNVAFGVREHAMGAAVNGMAAHGGILPFSATFLVRSIPGLNVLRPADATETAQAWAVALEHDGPTLFALSRQNLPHLDRSRSPGADVGKGAYILSEPSDGTPDVILIGSGSEVSLCMKAQEKLAGYGVKARVVSMPGWNLFAAQSNDYREGILPSTLKRRVTVEAAATFGWERWSGDQGTLIGIDHFGASAPAPEIMKHFGLTAEHVTSAALRLLGRSDEADAEYGDETTNVAPTGSSEGHS